MRLPALDVIAGLLQMADRLAEMRLDVAVGTAGTHGQQRDLVVEIDEAFDDHAAVADSPARHRVFPRALDILRTVELALALARTAHHRLDHARIADAAVDGLAQFLQRIAEAIRAGRQAQRFGREPANALAVHGQPRGAGGRDHADRAGRLERLEHRRGDRLDLGHHQVGPLGLDQRLQPFGVAHGDGARVMRDLLARRVLVAVDRDGFDAEPLQGDQHFLAELSGAEQHHFGGTGGQRRS